MYFSKKQLLRKFFLASNSDKFFEIDMIQYSSEKKRGKEVRRMIRNASQIRYEMRGDSMIVHVGGEIDHHSAVAVRTGIDAEITEKRPSRVMLELSAVDFMDSSGLGLIMGRFALIKQYGGTLAVLDPSPAVLRIIKLAGMERMVSILRTKKS